MTAAPDEQPPASHLRLVSVPQQGGRGRKFRRVGKEEEPHVPVGSEEVRPAGGEVPIGPEEFRQALAAHAAGVVVVTAQPDGEPVGLTATSFTSVSLAPPLVSFYVDQASTTWPALSKAEYFAVNVLASHQVELAARFARKGVDRFAAPTRWSPGLADVPLLEEVSGHLVCRAHHTSEVGDHILVVGLVVAAAGGDGRPLLYHQGRFGDFQPR
ncbi:flavin reductase family protein [Acrocarpospora sp. B8E8]|uniref:flavin reductase family protein n=1 Tax=Acrocarpospora sp. B8E8 TaxID=3153572 RepID=UPI00325CA8F8